MRWPNNSIVLEINTWTWLSDLTQKYGGPITLGNIPSEELDDNFHDFDAVWLMGVWERSPRGRQIATQHPSLQEEYRRTLPDFTPDDVIGSPYSIRRYRVDPRLGGEEGLAAVRSQLAERDVRLLLDFVPNHIGVDHDWTIEHPTYLIQGTEGDLFTHPDGFFRIGDSIFAHGRDPYFPPWTDTVQLNTFSRDTRQALRQILLDIAEHCDGVRCDMAMLVATDVFSRTWGMRAGAKPGTEFWEELIPTVKNTYPDFLLIAEVYWDMEWKLQQQGFDYCYDKRLYDRMLHQDAESIRAHLSAKLDHQSRLIRFIENHDEPRAPTVFGQRTRAAAILALTLPGAKLIHEGQTKGYRMKTLVQLGRRPDEPGDPAVTAFYKRLLKAASRPCFRYGDWHLCTAKTEDAHGDPSDLIAYTWQADEGQTLVIVNFGETTVQGPIAIEGITCRGGWRFEDLLTGETRKNTENPIDFRRLDVRIAPWNGQILV